SRLPSPSPRSALCKNQQREGPDGGSAAERARSSAPERTLVREDAERGRKPADDPPAGPDYYSESRQLLSTTMPTLASALGRGSLMARAALRRQASVAG